VVAVSVVVCTRDRPRQLARMLESAAALEVPPGTDWELLIVDNGSTGATAAAPKREAATSAGPTTTSCSTASGSPPTSARSSVIPTLCCSAEPSGPN
jgi:hypothetical protein